MIKTTELIVAIFLMICCFFAGVKYSDSVKSHASWLFENKEEEVELPDLSSEGEIEITAPTEAGIGDQAPVDQPAQPGAPADYIDGGEKPVRAVQ
jgi:hypothetical protein